MGAEVYGGVRLHAATTEEGCYRDLASWLDFIEFESIAKTQEALNAALDNGEILLWNVESQIVYEYKGRPNPKPPAASAAYKQKGALKIK